MLRGALQKYDQEEALKAAQAPPPKPAASQPRSSQTQSVLPGYRNPLQPAPSAMANSSRQSVQQQRPINGIKRTSSGLPKLGGSFEHGPGSRQDPINISEKSSRQDGMLVQICEGQFVDENDFDSDIDLDIEEPVAKKAPTYPTLPKQLSAQSAPTPIVYPTIPRQQQAQTTLSQDFDDSFEPFQSTKVDPPVASSAPIPWSSSPADHYSPALTPTRAQNKIQHFPYQAPGTSQVLNGRVAPPPPPKATQRRVLPWHKDERDLIEERARSQVAKFTGSSTHNEHSVATPSSKAAQRGQMWNTTASAIKEQQKRHREAHKVAMKKNAGDEESIQKAKTSAERPARVFLSEEQQHVLELVTEKKKSVFFTGSAGTGKSVLMREIIASLRRIYKREPDRVAVTASTGLAACNVGGVTLHSFAGIGLGKEEVPELVKKIKKNQKSKHRWLRTKVLVIDEVSMVDGDLFDKLEAIARIMRNNGRPFGGIQLVITGDFFQLPPVPDQGRIAKFAFDGAAWNTTIDHTIGLHHVFRQKDPIFAGMLNEMREGRLSQSSINAFKTLERKLNFEDELEATELFPTRNEVEQANFNRMRMLQGTEQIFEARDGGTIVDKAQRDKLLANCMAPERIILKKGAQVMLIKNVDEHLVNGSLGKVIGFMDEKKFDSYQEVDATVPLSSNGGLSTQVVAELSAEERQRKRIMDSMSTVRQWPVVRFSIADGTTRDLLCQPENWKIELPTGEIQASRSQIPLILAWALSIHKAQGQTLERVKVDLGKVFEKGQAYVALSRATSMAGLQVMRFDPKKVMAHEKVRTFYAQLSRVELEQKAKEKPKKVGMASEYEKRFLEEDEWDI